MSDTSNDRIWGGITEAIEELLRNEGRAGMPLTRQSSINSDLEISSLDFVHLLLGLEERLGESFPFERIALVNGQYRDDLTLGELHDFMVKSSDVPEVPAYMPGSVQPG